MENIKLDTLLTRLGRVQRALKVPKGQKNSFGNYNYRNAEDILEAVKPLLEAEALVLTLSDELVQVGERYYVKATAEVNVCEATGESVRVSGFAREEETKKGMDGSQITGASSSYARKYALNGLFLIDDTKDSDATNDHGKAEKPNTVAAIKPSPALVNAGKSIGLIHPALMIELRQAFKDAGLTGDAATAFVKSRLGRETPKSNDDAETLLAALRELTEATE